MVKTLSRRSGPPDADRSKRATIFSVAESAGVSITTVSHVLNYPDRHKYSATVEKKVLAACRRLAYRPNVLARSLAKRTTPAVGLLCDSLDDHNITRAVNRAVELAATNGLHVVISTKPSEIPWANLLEEGRVGWIISIVESMINQSRELMNSRLLERIISVTPGPVVDALPVACRIWWDERRNGRLIADHLAELGHREIAVLAGSFADPECGCWRLQEVYRRANELGLAPRWIVNAEEDKTDIPASGQRMMQETLERFPDVTAVVCRQDYHAIGAYRALIRAGKHIPDNMALVGNMDLQRMLYLDPPLTSVASPIVEGVEKAMEIFLQTREGTAMAMENLDLSEYIRLVVRGSTVRTNL